MIRFPRTCFSGGKLVKSLLRALHVYTNNFNASDVTVLACPPGAETIRLGELWGCFSRVTQIKKLIFLPLCTDADIMCARALRWTHVQRCFHHVSHHLSPSAASHQLNTAKRAQPNNHRPREHQFSDC